MHSVTAFRHRRRQRIIDYLGGQCAICKTTDRLEIDHVDPSTKSFTLSGNNLNRSWDYLLPEINKCQLLCKEHHIEKTRSENRNRVPWNKGPGFSHGTAQNYNDGGCRCDPCKKAKSLHRKGLLKYKEVIPL